MVTNIPLVVHQMTGKYPGFPNYIFPMTFYSFRLLSPVVQLYWVLKHGTYLAQGWEETPVDLYHFFDEAEAFLWRWALSTSSR